MQIVQKYVTEQIKMRSSRNIIKKGEQLWKG